MTARWFTDRCGSSTPDGACQRVVGHRGDCRSIWFAFARCAAWMPKARASCARRTGHAYEHRSAYALDNARRAA